MWRKLAALASIGALLIFGWLVGRPTSQSPPTSAPPKTDPAPPIAPEAASSSVSVESPLQAPTPTPERTTSPRRRRLAIVDSAGQPLAHANCRWIAIRSAWASAIDAWPELPFAELESATRVFDADAHGEVDLEFDDDPAADGYALWVLHPSAIGELRTFAKTFAPDDVPARITLRAGSPIACTVVDTTSKPVPGAQIRALVNRERLDLAKRPQLERIALLCSVIDLIADANGAATLPPIGLARSVVASSGSAMSRPWRGQEPAPAQLELRETFEVRVRLTMPDAVPVPPGTAVCVRTGSGTTRRPIGRVSVPPNGVVSPQRVPRLDEAHLFVHAEGAGLIPEPKILPMPSAGSVVDVELAPERGVGLRVRVLSGDEPLEDAAVKAMWMNGDDWPSITRRTSEDGWAVFDALRPGGVWMATSRAGHIDRTLGPYQLPAPNGQLLDIVLEKAGVLRGRVTHAGEAMKNFNILLWKGEPYQPALETFSNAVDGRFETSKSPLGEVSIVVISDTLPRSATHSAQVAEEEPGFVEIELDAPVKGRGLLVDARTLAPVAGAKVQLHTTIRGNRVRPVGEPVTSDAAGSFEFDRMAIGPNAFDIAATGYSPRVGFIDMPRVTSFDLGAFALLPAASLEVHLKLASGQDLANARCELRTAVIVPPAPFDASGVARFQGLPAAQCEAVAMLPGAADAGVLFDLISGEKTVVEIDLGQDSGLRARLEPTSPEISMTELFCVLRIPAPGVNALIRRFPIPVDGKFELGPIPTQRFSFDVQEGTTIVASRHIDRATLTSDEIVLRVPSESGFALVIDTEGRPVPRALLGLSLPQFETAWYRESSGDIDGFVEITALPVERCEVTIKDQNGALCFVGDVTFSRDRERPTQLLFDGSGALRARLLDGTTPVVGVEAEAWIDAHSPQALRAVLSNDKGEVDMLRFTCPNAWFTVLSPSVWPIAMPWPNVDPATRVDVQLRRRGSLELRPTRGGMAIRELDIALRNVEFDVDVAKWVAEGKVDARGGKLASDEHGVLRVDRLPRGLYRWTCATSDGAQVGGEFEVPAQALGQVEISVP